MHITKASYVNEYNIAVEFNDGVAGKVDLRTTIFNDHRKIFQELQNIEKFKDFHLECDTVVWANGLDLAPEYIHDKLINQKNNS